MQSTNVSSSAAGPRMKFVGVVANGRYLTLAEAGRPYVFVPPALRGFKGTDEFLLLVGLLFNPHPASPLRLAYLFAG